MDQLRCIFLVLKLIFLQISQVSLKCLIDLALNKLLQALILLHLQLYIVLLRDQELMATKLLLVQLKLLLECWHLVYHVSLRILQLFDDLGASAFLLAQSKFEILSLSFEHLSKLCFLGTKLFSLLFETNHSFVVLGFL